MPAELSPHFQQRHPSPIRLAQMLFAQRRDRDQVEVINVAIGNVSRPMHPAMRARLASLGTAEGAFSDGVVKYTPTVGTDEAQAAFKNIIGSTGAATDGLHCVVTDGGSQAMSLMVLGVCGPRADRPLLLLDPAYTNYVDMARRAGVPTVSLPRSLGDDGAFSPPDLDQLRQHVEDSEVIVLIQSKSVLSRPFCLVELITAQEVGTPVVGVCLERHAFPYDYGEASRFLTDLDTTLPEANPGADAVLAASVFHNAELTVGEVKQALREAGVSVR